MIRKKGKIDNREFYEKKYRRGGGGKREIYMRKKKKMFSKVMPLEKSSVYGGDSLKGRESWVDSGCNFHFAKGEGGIPPFSKPNFSKKGLRTFRGKGRS